MFDPRIVVSALYDDNYRLSEISGDEIDVAGGAIDATLAFRSERPRSELHVAPRIRSTFLNESSEESDDYFLDLGGIYRTQRTESGIRIDYSDQYVVTSELVPADFPGVDLGQTIGGDAGRVSVRNRRELFRVNPYTSIRLTERRSLQLAAAYLDASFDENLFEQVGFRDITGSAGLAFQVSPRSSVIVRGLASSYKADDADDDTTRFGAEAEWSTNRSETTRLYFRLGANRTERDASGSGQSVSNTVVVGGAGVRWAFQVTEVFFDVLRSVEPSSAGVVVDRDEVRLRLTRALRPRLQAFASLRGIRTEGAVEEVASIRDRDYVAANVGFEWRYNLQFSLRGTYDYRWQEFEGEPDDAQSNAVTLSVIYEPRRGEQ